MLKITTLLSSGLALVCAAGLAQAAPSATEHVTPQVKREHHAQPAEKATHVAAPQAQQVAATSADKAQNTPAAPSAKTSTDVTPAPTGAAGTKPAVAPQTGGTESSVNHSTKDSTKDKAPVTEATSGAKLDGKVPVPAAQSKAATKP